jgi:hypothetical protein
MNSDRPLGKKALRVGPGYEVGFAKTPTNTRFKPGQSGNPKGRPRGSKNKKPALHADRLKGIILDEAYRGIAVRDGDRNVTIPMAQAVMRSLAVNAAKGQHRAQRLFSELLASTERANNDLHLEWQETAITYKVEWEKELQRRERLGITAPEPIPHPDDIKIDFQTGEVRVVGPMTKEEKDLFDRAQAIRQDARDTIRVAMLELEGEIDPNRRAALKDEIARNQRFVEIMDEKLGKSTR